MTLDQYLDSLRNCSDEKVVIDGIERDKLTVEHGIYDNWPVFVRADYNSLIKSLGDSGKYQFVERINRGDGKLSYLFNCVSGIDKLNVLNFVGAMHTVGGGFPDSQEKIEHSERQMKDYNVSIILNPYKDFDNPQKHRLMVGDIENLVEFLKENKHSFCFPKSRGLAHLDDLSRVVYYDAGVEGKR